MCPVYLIYFFQRVARVFVKTRQKYKWIVMPSCPEAGLNSIIALSRRLFTTYKSENSFQVIEDIRLRIVH